MKNRVMILIFIMLLWPGFSLRAQEQLMTKLFFNKWLDNALSPISQQISQLQDTLAEIEQKVKTLRSQLLTEIKVTIGQTAASIGGKPATLDVAPLISDGRTMVPVRFIGEVFGAQFSWDDKTRTVTCSLGDVSINLVIGEKTARVNGSPVSLDAAPVIVNGRTLVPLRFIGESLGAAFEWDAQQQTATIFR